MNTLDLKLLVRPNILNLTPYRCARDDYSEGKCFYFDVDLKLFETRLRHLIHVLTHISSEGLLNVT